MKKFIVVILCLISISMLGWVGFCFYKIYQANVNLYDDLAYTAEQKTALTDYILDIETLPQISKPEWKEKVNNLVGFSNYIELDNDLLLGDNSGMCYTIANTIVIDKNISDVAYGRILLHELVHLTKWTINERKTEFLTFKLAFESDDPYMKAIAFDLADISMYGTNDEYTCTGRIIDYLETRGEI